MDGADAGQGVSSGSSIPRRDSGGRPPGGKGRPPGHRLSYRAAIYLAIAAVSLLHYIAPPHAHQLHDVYRRLYYLPIILAAFVDGLPGGLIASAVVSLLYLPHALGHISHDPASPIQKTLEIVLYFAVGAITGSLVSRLKGTQGKLEQTAGDLRDSLLQLRSTEEQLVRTAKLAAVGRLSAGLAHEVRNPLGSIKGAAEILADDLPVESPKRRLLKVLVDESVRLNDVLTRFLAFARPRPLERTDVDPVREIEEVLALLGSQRGDVGFHFAPERGTLPLRLRADREQLRQVLLNLLLNAAQAAGPGGRVEIACYRRDELLWIRVRDSGPGFSREAIENAFTPFYTTREQGTGLGLALSHRIIESHGGRIRVGNHPEGGGLVEIELPLAGTATASAAPSPS